MNAPSEALVRSTYLGSSDIAAVLGLDKNRTALDVWLCKVEPERAAPVSDELRKLFARGKRFEPVIRETAEDEYGLQIIATNKRYSHVAHPFLRAEVDFEVLDDTHEIINCEAKSVHPSQFKLWGAEDTDEIPVHYYAQVMYALAVTGRQRAWVFALFGSDNLVRYVIERDEEAIEGMIAQAVAFWEDHVLARVEPPPQTIEDAAIILDRWKKGLQIAADSEIVQAIVKIDQLEDAITSAESEIATLKAEFAAWVTEAAREHGDADAGKVSLYDVNGKVLCTWNKQRGVYLDQKGLKAQHPDIHSKYTREHFYRVLRIK